MMMDRHFTSHTATKPTVFKQQLNINENKIDIYSKLHTVVISLRNRLQ